MSQTDRIVKMQNADCKMRLADYGTKQLPRGAAFLPRPLGEGWGEGAPSAYRLPPTAYRLPPSPFRLPPPASRGFTLMELLIVVLIISTVTVATIPFLKPAMDNRRIREAARIVTTQLAAAQNEAVASGHSVGVWFEKIHAGGASSGIVPGDASMDLYLCETPQPYSGDGTNSTVAIQVNTTVTPNQYSIQFQSDTAWQGLLRAGDMIRFNYRGPWYVFTSDTAEYLNQATNTLTLADANGIQYLDNSMTKSFDRIRTSLNPPNPTQPYNPTDYLDCQMPLPTSSAPFQIIRQPIKSASTPIQLPSGAVVDLYYSGAGNGVFFGAPSKTEANNPVIVTFDATGALDGLYLGGAKRNFTGALYFLIGKREKVPSVESDVTQQNWADQENLWISINPQSGLASTAEVAPPSATAITPAQQLLNSRGYATSAQAMGGK